METSMASRLLSHSSGSNRSKPMRALAAKFGISSIVVLALIAAAGCSSADPELEFDADDDEYTGSSADAIKDSGGRWVAPSVNVRDAYDSAGSDCTGGMTTGAL